MARPRSEEKRKAILEAAIRVIANNGLGASTAMIAEEAKVASGTLFVYFRTKGMLLDELYLLLKGETASAASPGDLQSLDVRARMSFLWKHWIQWGVTTPERRRTLTMLTVSNEISPEARRKGQELMSGISQLMDQSRQGGPLRDAPLDFVVALISHFAETTIDYMVQSSKSVPEISQLALDSLWKMLE